MKNKISTVEDQPEIISHIKEKIMDSEEKVKKKKKKTQKDKIKRKMENFIYICIFLKFNTNDLNLP